MSDAGQTPQHELDRLGRLCAEQTNLFFRQEAYDPSPCMALFRLAIVERDSAAWDKLFDQYHALVRAWVSQHRQFRLCQEEADVFVMAAFEKMWRAISPARFDNFRGLPSLLNYLKMCAHSSIVDYARSLQRRAAQIDMDAGQHAVTEPDPEATALQNIATVDLWRTVEGLLQGPAEQVVVYESFVWDLSPQQIWHRHQDLFISVQSVYNVKRNALARLERSPILEPWRMTAN